MSPGSKRVWIYLFGGATVLGLFFSGQSYLYYRLTDDSIPWWHAFAFTMPDWYLWALIAFPVVRLSRRFRLEKGAWGKPFAIHMLASVVLSFLHILLAVTFIFMCVPGFAQTHTWSEKFWFNFTIRFHWNVVTYWAIVGMVHAIDSARASEERRRRAAQLESELAQAQLEALKSQLQPHFLFNTLNAITALMRSDVGAAERMMTRLSDLLRTSLESAGIQEVPLEKEIEFLRSYLEIQQIRFSDRLKVRFGIDPETLDASVPNLILQPLVENAIRHGIASRMASGTVEVMARRRDGMLSLEVRDDGPGMSAGGPVREGIGLSTTRARLRQLYGESHRFEIRSAEGKGTDVRLEIPFRTFEAA
jgi:two-component system LytT family sensor kinase